MNILLLGSGGREHAFAHKITQSKKCSRLFIAPGNAGTATLGENIPISENDFEKIGSFVRDNKIELVVVGPEVPLVNGIHDYFLADEYLKKVPVIGPVKAGAILEGSKDFSKAFMQKHNIPTARYETFTSATLSQAKEFLKTLTPPYVLKADGLAAGKGVVIPETLQEAEKELDDMLLDQKFGAASAKVVIEEFLKGIELSVFVATDGVSYKTLPAAKDYKRIGVGDTGLNTGGMGAVSPVPFADDAFMQKVEERIIKPTIEGFKKDNIDYTGFVFIGLMKVGGDPFVIEYNCRMGDPETEAVLPRIKTDIVDLFVAMANKKLSDLDFEISPEHAATVMLVAGGYPGEYEKDKEITIDNFEESLVFHAGTKNTGNKTVTNGGRVIAVTTLSSTLKKAVETSLKNAEKIQFEGRYFRNDIGKDVL